VHGISYVFLGIFVVLALAAAALYLARLPPPEPRATVRVEAPAERATAPIVLAEGSGHTRHPIVLVHGLFGFDSVRIGASRHDYFRGVRDRLEALGNRVEIVRLPPTAGVKARAAELAEQVRALDAPRVNLIAHSMGGLDARFAIAKLGLADRVASLTTLGTPHRGTPLADGTVLLGRTTGLHWLLERAGMDGVADVTTHRMKRFNREVPDMAGVAYFSYVAAVEPARKNLWLWPALVLLGARSDGLVPAASQRWGDVRAELAVDHWGQIGWSSDFDAGALYERIARDLARRGL
jgi:triacylglycerol lipase